MKIIIDTERVATFASRKETLVAFCAAAEANARTGGDGLVWTENAALVGRVQK